MAERPLLILPAPGDPAARRKKTGRGGTPRLPSRERQGERLGPRFTAVQRAFDARRARLQADATNVSPEQVIVLETVGTVDDFVVAERALRMGPKLRLLRADHCERRSAELAQELAQRGLRRRLRDVIDDLDLDAALVQQCQCRARLAAARIVVDFCLHSLSVKGWALRREPWRALTLSKAPRTVCRDVGSLPTTTTRWPAY